MGLFDDEHVNLTSLRQKAYNYRWATLEEGIIPLTAADPDFPVAEPIVRAIHDYSKDGYFSYGPAEGLMAFKEAIATWYLQRHTATVTAAYILPVNSAAFGLFTAAQCVLRHGDNAIIPDPVDFLFRKSIENAGAKVKTTELDKQTGEFNFAQLEELVDEKTKAIFICNPNNPLGLSSSITQLNALIAFAERHDLWIVSDEIWADIDYFGTVTSMASNRINAYAKRIVVSGLSKNFGLAGLRIGYIIAPDELTYQKLLYVSKHQTTAFGLSGIAQVAGTAALLESAYWLDEFLIHLKKMRALTLTFIDELGTFSSVSPVATYLAFPKLISSDLSSEQWVKTMLDASRVALVPGGKNWFEESSEGHVRICYATSKGILTEAFERMLAVRNQFI
jgi:aspartate/methionine/tyrosine aminotransferase